MRNITLSVDAKVLAAVRRYAAERDCSVNALVREYLTGIAERQARAREARSKIRALSRHSRGRFLGKTWSRDELHER
jgi:hypothetical protein